MGWNSAVVCLIRARPDFMKRGRCAVWSHGPLGSCSHRPSRERLSLQIPTTGLRVAAAEDERGRLVPATDRIGNLVYAVD